MEDNVNDSAGSYNGTAVGSPTYAAGKLKQCLVTNGSSQYATTALNALNDVGSAGTIALWFKTSSASEDAMAGAFRTTRCYLAIKDTKLAGGIGTQSYSTIVGSTSCVDNAWHHGAITWDGSTVRLFLDGAREYNAAQAGAIPNQTFHIGCMNQDSATHHWPGSLDDVRIYNRALNHQEVGDLYNGGVGTQDQYTPGNSGALANGLVAHYQFREGAGDLAADSVQKNGATLYNSPTWTTGVNGQGGALQFDGATEYGDCGNDTSLKITDNISVCLWVNAASVGGDCIFSKYDTGANQRSWGIFTASGAGNLIDQNISANGRADIASHFKQYRTTLTVCDSTWHHYCFTFSSGTLKIHVDGVEDPCTKVTDGASCTSVFDSTTNVAMACFHDSGAQSGQFPGTTDDIRVYSRVLSTDEIREIYNGGHGSKYGYETDFPRHNDRRSRATRMARRGRFEER
jgi:hypothetical protein